MVRVTINTLEAQRHQCKPKRPEPPTPEDIWGATTPLEKKKSGKQEGESSEFVSELSLFFFTLNKSDPRLFKQKLLLSCKGCKK